MYETTESKPSGAPKTHAVPFSKRNVDDAEWTAITDSIGGVDRNPALQDA